MVIYNLIYLEEEVVWELVEYDLLRPYQALVQVHNPSWSIIYFLYPAIIV
jgi:hypothetical protein